MTPAPAEPLPTAQRGLHALAWSYGGAIGRALSQLVVQLLLARLIGPQGYGEAMAVFVVQTLGWLLAEGGFSAALVQKAELHDDDVRYALGWVLLISGGIAAAVWLGAGLLADLLGHAGLRPLLQACALLIPLQALSSIPASLLRRELDMQRSQLVQLGSYVLAYGAAGLALAWAGAGAWSLVAAYGLYSLIDLVGSIACLRRRPARWWLPLWRGDHGLRRYGLQVTGTNLVNWAIDNVDRLLVGRWWGAAALGHYAVAANLSRAPANLLVSSVQSVAFSYASRLQHDPAALRHGYLAAVQVCALLACPMFAWLALHAQAVIALLYDARWLDAAPLFAAFCAALPLYTVLAVSGPVLWAVGAVKAELRAQLLCLAVLGSGLLMGRNQPLHWVVWLLPLVQALRLALVYRPLADRLQLAHRHMGRALLPGLLLAGVMVLSAWAVDAGLVRHATLGATAGAALAGLLGCAAAAWLLWAAPGWWLGPAAPAMARWVNRTRPTPFQRRATTLSQRDRTIRET